MPATSFSALTPSPFASLAMVLRRGSRTARSRRDTSVGWIPALAESCSCVSFAALRCRRRFEANRSSGLTAAILRQVGQ
jgi:hypothetical protein